MSEIILDSQAFQNAVKKVAGDIFKDNKNISELAIVGVHNKGVCIAKRILSELAKLANVGEASINFGTLDITLYRDDLDDFGADMPVIKDTEIPFDISQKKIILVDDVLYTGRTVRASLDVLMDFGRPKSIQLAVLVDRGHRELPIEAGYAGIRRVIDGKVKVECKEIEGEDKVFVL
ncbi:bifunctional pyr operon transcriptional regulator/uracil phosphoribosyltransferase PyrR [Endomicrobium proavitum]|uniref:Bifunctional protein PyrR n=1 Tax=Endomicrobium proavitum TaxID=1408281 RepID=A0A0G3WHB4_9BACT|nr:bifunctional pyr operon transcriptional regulator/uracil phosphoribosyltransferase PyrR [Endomicrobium proavitum]AKL98016.1 transcriptional attenuator and uracil phosphoribosyltransferase activity [Endomicrobium proavitum]